RHMAATAFEKSVVVTTAVLALVTLTLLATNRPAARPPQFDGQQLTYFIADGDPRTGYQPSDRQLAQWAFESWARHAPGAFDLQASPVERDALVRLYWAPLQETTFGEMRRLVVNGHQGAAVFVRADMSALGLEMEL